MYKNKRGVALLQVLMITVLIGGLAAMVLRAVLSRTTTSRQTRHTVASQLAIQTCMAEVNAIWALKTPEQYETDLTGCAKMIDTWSGNSSITDCDGNTPSNTAQWYCRVTPYTDGTEYCVTATIQQKDPAESSASPCKITYTVKDGLDL